VADGELVELVRKLAAEFCDAQCALILNRKRLPHGRADLGALKDVDDVADR